MEAGPGSALGGWDPWLCPPSESQAVALPPAGRQCRLAARAKLPIPHYKAALGQDSLWVPELFREARTTWQQD